MSKNLDESKPLLVKTTKGIRIIPVGKWYINRGTEVGEDAYIWERKPHGGRKYLDIDKVAHYYYQL